MAKTEQEWSDQFDRIQANIDNTNTDITNVLQKQDELLAEIKDLKENGGLSPEAEARLSAKADAAEAASAVLKDRIADVPPATGEGDEG